MVNSNYVKGRNKEYRLKKQFEAVGFVCTRSAGSHGIWDLVCVHPKEGIIKFIQAKPKDFSKKQLYRLHKGNNWLNGTWEGEYIVL